MSDGEARGPQVDSAEDMYRAIPIPDWWDSSADPPRPRSLAFKISNPFSVNIVSEIGLDGAIRHLRDVLNSHQGGIVSFNCGNARTLGFDARRELDVNYPENVAHANVYYNGTNSSRKKRAKKLATEYCQTVLEPSF